MTEPRTTKEVADEGGNEFEHHYMRKEDILDAMVNGTPHRALCGTVFIPVSSPQTAGAMPDESATVCRKCSRLIALLKRSV